jgi:beta-lactamase regulating signal transducer with metallopeptidase domain
LTSQLLAAVPAKTFQPRRRKFSHRQASRRRRLRARVSIRYRKKETQTAWRAWFAQIIAVRDAIAGLTPIPTGIWLGGSVIFLLALAGRIVRFRRLLRSAQPAPREVVELVGLSSSVIGLRTAPTVMMTFRKISPLVWCGRQRLLVLPIGLWNELDDDGRSAVLLHELAHLKRRDHLICWVEMIISLLYWWHPLVWWVRRKLRDEADFACDAWVTALLPGSRRAYASALLTTRQFVSEFHNAAPAVGLGVSTPRAKRFARRLTMVMTERSGPRLSIMGIALAACLAAAGWLAAPIFACPPTEECTEQAAQTAQAAKNKAKLELEKAMTREKKAAARGGGVTTYEAYMADRDALPRANPDDLRGRIDRLEQRLDRLTEHLEKLLGSPRSEAPGGQHGIAAATMAPVRVQPRIAEAPGAGPTLRATVPVPGQPAPPAARAFAPGAVGFAGAAPGPDSDETEVRLYRLPEGKRDDFTKFMSRSDVPIFVSPAEDGINVHATPRQHEVIRGFINLIHPEGAAGGGAWRSTFEGFGPEGQHLTAIARTYEQAAREAVKRGDLAAAEAVLQNGHMQREVLARQMVQMRNQAEQMRKQAVELQRRSEELHGKAEKLSEGPDQYQIRAEADAIAAQAEALEEAAAAHDEQAESVDEAIESIQDEVEELVEEAREAAAEAEEAAADEDEEEDD